MDIMNKEGNDNKIQL